MVKVGKGERERVGGRERSARRKRRLLFFGLLGILGVWGLLYLFYLPDGKLRLVFCDVGQGDGIYIDLPDGKDVLIDGGPDRKVLDCLGRNMPFWDRKLELVVLTHPQADHLNGLIEVVKRYEVDLFISSPIGNDTKGYQGLVREIRERGVRVRNVYAGDKIKFKAEVPRQARDPDQSIGSSKFKINPKFLISLPRRPAGEILNKFQILNSKFKTDSQLPVEVAFRVLWPSREFVVKSTQIKQISTDLTDQQAVLGVNTAHDDLNDFSIVMELKFGEFEVLLTGDAGEEIQDEIMAVSQIRPVEVFKIPHHGSKYGILDDYLQQASPKFAVVSVGKNRWGHPDKLILERLEIRDLRLWRTDKDGDVTFTTDGKQVWIGSDKK